MPSIVIRIYESGSNRWGLGASRGVGIKKGTDDPVSLGPRANYGAERIQKNFGDPKGLFTIQVSRVFIVEFLGFFFSLFYYYYDHMGKRGVQVY